MEIERGEEILHEYVIHWIRREFAHHYFYKSDILYRFIKEYENNLNRDDLKKQYEYVTNDFSKSSIIRCIRQFIKNKGSITVNGNHLFLMDSHTSIDLHVFEKQIYLKCENLIDAEELLFPALRTLQPYLFITGVNLDNYGWMDSPWSVQRIL